MILIKGTGFSREALAMILLASLQTVRTVLGAADASMGLMAD